LHINFNKPDGAFEEFKATLSDGFLDGADHTHPSAGNIIINAGNEILLMDAPYFGFSNKDHVNEGNMHNVVSVNGIGPIRTDDPKVEDFSISEKSIKISTKYEGPTPDAKITREIQVHEFTDQDDNVRYYYEVIDACGPKPDAGMLIQGNTFALNLNGNGSLAESTCDNSRIATGQVLWKYPCLARNTWKLYARTSLSSPWPAAISYNVSDEHKHGNDNFTELISFNSEPNSKIATGSNTSSGTGQGQGTYGTHATFKASVTAEKVTFQTILFPLKCDEPDFPPDSFWVRNQNDSFYSVSTLKDLGSDHVSNIHIKKGHSFKDTIQIENALFNSDLSQLSHVKLIGDKGLLSISRDSVFKRKNCIAYTKFRRASIHLGKLLMMNDTIYITSSKTSNVDYKIIGPAKYVCNYKTDTACTINLFLAGMERGKSMKVEGYTSTYDTGTCIMSIDLPVGQNQFEIELTDPCLVSCFFPSTQETIHETFNFNEGITATLGHKLDIVQPHGFLNISKGSHMKICNGVYLRNRDSLVLYSGCGKDTGQLSISTCDGRSNGNPSAAMEGVGGGAKASMISVMDGAALILDDSSFTQISNNSELHVWGSLVIKAGAKLLIGDGRKCSYASIMVYPGAYVHIEDEAHLEFFKIVGDTQDRHIFFVSKLPTAASAIKGVAPSIVNLLLTDTILTGSETPVELCDLYTVTPDHGIANREWGFSNILKPKADIWVPNDTICQGECLLIDFSASLNDPIRSLEVCRIDTIFGLASEVCFGSMRIEGMQLTQGYNESSECYYSEASLKMFPLCNYIDSGNAWYKIFVKVENHCGIEDTQSVYFFVAKKPSALLALADTFACGGYGTVKAYNYSLVNAEKAIYHVHVIDTTQYQDGDENRFFYGADWELYNLHYGDSFEFPDFNWQGGFTYAVSLTQYGWCGESNTSWDTIKIQPGAVILASPASVYSNPLGPSALQLQGFVGNADYYTWSPTTDLDNPYVLNPIATPTDTITYILSAFKGSCEAHDTLFVRHNTLAYAGPADTICAGESIILGTSFDASLFLGYQFYENHLVLDEINERLGIDINFFSKLSLYLLSDAGKTALNSCVNYSTFLSTLNRNQFYQEPWYAAYLESFTNTYNFNDAFSLFVSGVNNNITLSNYIGSNTLFDPTCFEDFLNQYQRDIHQIGGISLNATWEKFADSISTVLTHYTDQIKATDTLSKPSTYKITVIDNNVGKVEYDQVNIWVQQNIQPQFFVQFQIDSTLYFSNQSEPIDYSTQYLWDFGDGQTSTQLNPIYTFPFFDSSYVVCLSATNRCGTFTVCDTIRVDSSGLIAYSFSKKLDEIGKAQEFGSAQIKREITVQSFPNPIKNEVSFVYDIPQAYENGEIVLMNYVGQTLQKTNIKNAKGLVKMNLDGHSSGMFLYQIIIDAHVVNTGKLVKE